MAVGRGERKKRKQRATSKAHVFAVMFKTWQGGKLGKWHTISAKSIPSGTDPSPRCTGEAELLVLLAGDRSGIVFDAEGVVNRCLALFVKEV